MSERVTIELIAQAVSDVWGVSLHDLRGQRRFTSITVPRQVAFALARKYTDHSFPVIGRWFGDRDHTTVIHGIRRYDGELRDLHHQEIDQVEALIDQRRRAVFIRGAVPTFQTVRSAA